jgi:hypothetical protein
VDEQIRRERRKRDRIGVTHTADFLYDGVYSGALGGAVVALFFLGLDTVRGEPLFTASLLGHILFLRVPPEAVTEVRLDLVAYFSILHIFGFAFLGFAMSAIVQRWEELPEHPVVDAVIIFLILEAAILIPARFVMPGAVGAIGIGWLALANVLTATAMAFFLKSAHAESGIRYVKMRKGAGVVAPEPDPTSP